MALIPIIVGAGLVITGSLVAVNAGKRRPLPADVRAQVIAAFQSRNEATIAQVLNAVQTGANGAFKGQGEVLQKAIQLGLDALKSGTKVPADISALWWGAITSGDPATMRKTGASLQPKYNTLSAALTDCARILGG
jgi:hypothetical protein